MFVIVWTYRVQAGQEGAFERLYGPRGAWAELFSRSPGYLGTELARDPLVIGNYLTVDRWRSRADFERFEREHAVGYAALDRQCDRLTHSETRRGAFERIA